MSFAAAVVSMCMCVQRGSKKSALSFLCALFFPLDPQLQILVARKGVGWGRMVGRGERRRESGGAAPYFPLM